MRKPDSHSVFRALQDNMKIDSDSARQTRLECYSDSHENVILKLDPLFWRRVLGKNYFFAGYRIHSSAPVRPVCGALWRQLQGQSVFVLGSVFMHGLCTNPFARVCATSKTVLAARSINHCDAQKERAYRAGAGAASFGKETRRVV